MVRTPLDPEHVKAMHRVGRVEDVPAGTMAFQAGDVMDRFCFINEGEVESIDRRTGGRYGEGATLGPTQYFGEISFLSSARLQMGARTVVDTKLLCVERETMLELMSRIPEMSDIIITVLAARRRRLLESDAAALTLIGAEVDRKIRAIASFAGRNRIPFNSMTLGEH